MQHLKKLQLTLLDADLLWEMGDNNRNKGHFRSGQSE